MKTLIQESMKIIENFSSDGNLATKLYKKAKYISSESQENHKGIRRQTKILHNQHSVKKTQNTCDSKKKDSQYIAVYHALKELQQANYDAKEPDLIKLLKEVSETEEPYRYKKGNSKKGRYRTLKKPLLRLLNINRRLESSCIAVILFTTGMRSSELKRLKRFPEITNDENLNLSRLIYKTAQTEQGEILSMPIPEITKKALNVLSKISQLSDNEKEGDLIVGSIYSLLDSQMSQVSIRDKLIYLCKHVGIPNIITSHQFRHTMAFLISYSNQKDGLELAKTFLGHKSTEMTLKYMGHYNGIFKDTLRLMSQKNTKAIISEINKQTIDGKKIYGQKGERILQKHQFIGSYAENVTDILDSKLIELAKKGTLKIIQTPVSICIIDTDEDQCELEPLAIKTPNEQLDIDLYSNIDTSLKKRLETNTYFIENGGFDSLKSSIKKQENKEKKTTCLD